MEKRKIVFGTYDTAAKGWTLTGWKLSDAVQKTHFIDKPGGDGSWNFSTILTQGIPRYSNRQLAAFFECSEGDRLSREALIREMVNTLDGMEVDIYLPDDPYHHARGLLHVAREYNDMAHARVSVTATCEPWKHANEETVYTLTVEPTKVDGAVVFTQKTIDLSKGSVVAGFQMKIEAGLQYIVYWNGTAYVCTAYTSDGQTNLGNASIYDPTATDTGEPFVIFGFGGTSNSIYTSDTNKTVSLKITEAVDGIGEQKATLINNGRRAVVPVLQVIGSGASMTLKYGQASLALSEGTHKWPDLLLTPGSHELTYSGSGSLVVTYREAVLE